MRMLKLEDVARWGSGGTPKRSVSHYFGAGVPWLSISDLNDGLVKDARESLTQAGLDNSAAKIVPAGTILVAMYGSIGKLGVAERELCTSQAIAHAIPDNEVIDTRYLFHYLRYQRTALLNSGRGGAQKNISQNDLKKWPVPVFSLEEQRRLAGILDTASSLQEARREILNLLDALSESMLADLTETCSDFVRLGDVSSFVRGVTFKPDDKVAAGPGSVAVMRTKNVQRVLDRSDEIYIPSALVRRTDQYLQVGDTLISSANSWNLVGKACYVGDLSSPAAVGGFVTALRPNGRLDSSFIFHWLVSSSVQAKMRSFSSQTTNIANLDLKRCAQLHVPLPSVADQEEFQKRASAIEDQRQIVQHALRIESELLTSLRSRAFRGVL